jgi:hypothetical protein
MFWIIFIVFVIALIYSLRTIGLIILLVSIVYWFTSPDDAQVTISSPTVMSYQELVDYPVSCEFKEQQLVELKNLQTLKNFNPDPDLLNEDDHAFNSRLKATIWWYAYRCDQS